MSARIERRLALRNTLHDFENRRAQVAEKE
jgi:hypothetical protein